MNKISLYTLTVILGVLSTQGFAQKQDATIGSEVVNVVGTYTPTISDAFKVKETPSFDDATITNKEQINYSISSFPVASTFIPAKGSAQALERAAKEKYFNNYASLGIGNYGTALAELYLTHNISRNKFVGGLFKHHSSQGGIDGVVLDDFFYDTSADIVYASQESQFKWNVDLGFRNHVVNWYGLPIKLIDVPNGITGSINEKQKYNSFYLGGKILMNNEQIFRGADLYFKRFSDGYDSGENRFILKPSFQYPISNQLVKFDLIADYVGTKFNKDYYNTKSLEYSYFNFGVQPSFNYQYNQIAFKLGAGLFYSAGKFDSESKNKIYFYPQVQASYRVVGDLMIAYAGLEGSLKQNSFADFANENPFINPTIAIAPTNNVFDLYVGLKGKLANNIAYNVRGSYANEKNKALFGSRYDVNNTLNTEGYVYGNSFDVIYDDVKNFGFFGELKADINKSVSVSVNGNFNSYKTDAQKKAWHLPSLRLNAVVEASITDKFSMSANVFYVGERDIIANYQTNLMITQPAEPLHKKLDGYVDVNLGFGYKYNDRLDFFLRANNLFNQDYEKWFNYQVQGIQILGGASYKFDF